MMSYVGHYRMPLWLMIGAPLLVLASGWFTWAVSQDAQYAEMLAHPGGPYGWLVTVLPRPALLAVGAAATIGFAFGAVMMAMSAAQRKVAFTIDTDGVRQYRIFGSGVKTSLKWTEISGFSRVKSIRMLHGVAGGREVTVALNMLGHDRKAVFDAILAHRPDLQPYLD